MKATHKYNPARGGHAPGDLREEFHQWVENDTPISHERALQLTGKLWNCTDCMPGSLCDDLDLLRGSSYTVGARKVRADLIETPEPSTVTIGNEKIITRSQASALKEKKPLQSFDLLAEDDDPEDDEGLPINICDFTDCVVGTLKLELPKGSVTKSGEISILFDYPLTNPTMMTFKHAHGFSRIDFFECVYRGYLRIYNAEKDPGTMGGTLINRAESQGKYGIWGHYLEDLGVDGVNEVDQDVFVLSIGS